MPAAVIPLQDYLDRVASATAALLWSDLAPRGVVVAVEGGGARARAALLGGDDFTLDVVEDVTDPGAGGTAVGRFVAGPYHGRLERQPDQVAFLLEPSGGDGAAAGLDAEWRTGPRPAPDTVDPESWAEYGFPRAIETVTLHKGGAPVAYGCLMPFAPDVVEVALLVERPARSSGAGRQVAEALFERAAARGAVCHWATMAANAASQRLGRRRAAYYEACITAYAWS
jgi:GNAT superfamily N-acetyltransferase